MALKISAVNWCKKNIFISTYVEFYREQGHIHFLTMHWKIWAADAKKYFFEGLSVDRSLSFHGGLRNEWFGSVQSNHIIEML